MPGPPTINWYRADLRSACLGASLSRQIVYINRFCFSFLPPSHSSVHQVLGLVYWLVSRMGSRQNGKTWHVNCSSCIDVTGFFKNAQGHVHLPHEYMCYRIHLRPFVGVWSYAQFFLYLLPSLTSSPFGSGSPSSLPFAILVALLSNISLHSLALPLLIVIQGEEWLCVPCCYWFRPFEPRS